MKKWLLMLSLFVHFAACATERIQLKVVTEHWPPYNYVDEDGHFQGIATNKLKRVLARADVDYDLNLLSWNKAYKLTQKTPNVVLFTVYRLKHRENDFQWICPLIKTGEIKMFALRDRHDLDVQNLNDAKNDVIGTVRTGSTYEFLVKSGFKPNIHLDLGTDEMANVKKLVAGRVDIVVQQSDLLIGRLERAGSSMSEVKALITVEGEGNKLGCMAMSKSTPKATVDKLRQALIHVNLEQQASY